MNGILTNIKNELQTISELQNVETNWGQLDYYSPNFPDKWPWVLVEVSNINYSEEGTDKTTSPINRQTALADIKIRIADQKVNVSGVEIETAQLSDLWDLIEKIHNKLQGFYPGLTNSGKLIRNNTERIERKDGIQEYMISYSLTSNDV